ncbi:YceD family protein [Pseudoroseomonas ludipueritiae]|uniref:DUF177 domain-containing protein n=1 Tax=Pseudoroseomonas ludipueritiae TaxID=198093 RepID=A0ABR7R197_9PROT|nr:DUF177 domain-containing protein [Pseudoroseomonas ludipueritiae]MBC9175509.1 DUF177 domain-containing protein [Pseudoroseomonas ludipueritiae]
MTDIAPEFSRTLPWGAVSRKEKREELEATEAERAALADRFGILEIGSLRASLRLRVEAGGAVRVRGQLTADVVQACVVTLEPVPQHIEEPVDLRFLPEGAESEEDPDGPDEIPTEGEVLELGEAIAEQLSLALDPYPRAPGAKLELDLLEEEEEPEEEPARPNPFAKLSALKGKK